MKANGNWCWEREIACPEIKNAGEGNRTLTRLPRLVFETSAYTSSAIPAIFGGVEGD